MDRYCTPRSQVMHQARQVSTGSLSLPDGHSQGVQGQVGAHWPVGGLPADDPPRVHVSHESHIDPPGEGAYTGGGTVCGGMSATHSPPGANASKWRLTRSAGHCSRGALRVVRGDLARRTPRRPRSPMRRTGGTAGHVTGTVTLGNFGSAPYHVHLAGPQHRGSWFLWTLDISALRASSRRLLALGGRLRRA